MTTTSQANQAMNATSSDGPDAGAVVRSMETRAIKLAQVIAWWALRGPLQCANVTRAPGTTTCGRETAAIISGRSPIVHPAELGS